MDHATLEALKRGHPGWRLLAADHAPMIVSFLNATFIEPNARTVPQQALIARLDDWLYQLRQRAGPEAYPRSAAHYLDTWADDEHAQISLAELLDAHPLEQGLAELVAYMSLASDDTKALIDDHRTQTLVWSDPRRGPRQATLRRTTSSAGSSSSRRSCYG